MSSENVTHINVSLFGSLKCQGIFSWPFQHWPLTEPVCYFTNIKMLLLQDQINQRQSVRVGLLG